MGKSGPNGLHLNTDDGTVVRVNSPYPIIPDEGNWVHVTDDPNMTIVAVRQLAKEKNLYSKPDEIRWL